MKLMITDERGCDREVLYEDDQFSERNLAALVASKVYYHLGEYDESMMFALGAGDLFDITAKSEYVETMICKGYPILPITQDETKLANQLE